MAGDQDEYFLNGDRVISPYPKNCSYGGVIFEYSGTDTMIEKISTPYSKPLQRDLYVEVVFVILFVLVDLFHQNT